MKRILLFAVLCGTIFLSNCKDKKGPEDFILGKWKATKMIADGEDITVGDDEYKVAVEMEFTNAGSVIFTFKELDLTSTPPAEDEYTIAGNYSWSGDNQLTITINDGGDILTVTGTADVTASRFIFTASSGDIEDFITIIEADKL